MLRYRLVVLIIVVLANTATVLAFVPRSLSQRLLSSRLHAVPAWLTTGANEPNHIEESSDKIVVRFINTVGGKDVVAHTFPGDNLLTLGDSVGVKLPRACRTGLCGSCTCDVKDPNAQLSSSNKREGFVTLRACSTKCFVPEGMEEMVVDVHRMRRTANAAAKRDLGYAVDKDEYVDPMARFGENWEKEFRPQWELGNDAPGRGSDTKSSSGGGMNSCQKCKNGRVVCYNCFGVGLVRGKQCPVCVGVKDVGCGYCRGTGKKNFK